MAVVPLKSTKIDADLGWLSTDTKPTTNIPNGWVGLELDTGNKFVFNAGAWYPYSQPTKLTGSLANQIVFQNASTTTGNGTSLTVGGFKNLTVGITSAGGNTARTIEFHGVDAAGNDNLMTGINKNGLNPATSTINTGETWQFDITGLVSVYMKLLAITGGNVTVSGLAVA